MHFACVMYFALTYHDVALVAPHYTSHQHSLYDTELNTIISLRATAAFQTRRPFLRLLTIASLGPYRGGISVAKLVVLSSLFVILVLGSL
jgi:hypothetical protein